MSRIGKRYFDFALRCDATQAYNFLDGHSSRTRVSFTELGHILVPDLIICDPTHPDNQVSVAGVVDSISWCDGPIDPVSLEFRVSSINRVCLQSSLTSASMAKVETSWVIYDYDHAEKRYFGCFHTDDVNIKAVIAKDAQVLIQTASDMISQQPCFSVITSLSLINEIDQMLMFGIDSNKKLAMNLEILIFEYEA